MRIALLATIACAALALPLLADEIVPTEEPKAIGTPAESHVHFLLKTEFASGYTTPRGMIVRDQGLTIQPLLLMFVDLYQGGQFINRVKAVGGVWNDLDTSGVSEHAPFGSDPKTHWTEIDPIGGLSISFAKRFTLDVTYTAFIEHILDIPDSQHLETKLSFDDSDFLGAYALHPYLLFWQELKGKSTSADVPYDVLGPSPDSGDHPHLGESFYFELGITPGYTFKNAGNLKLEAPAACSCPTRGFTANTTGTVPRSACGNWG